MRGVKVLALSVDDVETSARWKADKGFEFDLACDPELETIRAWDLENEENGDLAYHAVYLIEPDGRISYTKIGRRRPQPQELLHAIDGDAVECCPGSCKKGEPLCRPLPG